MQKKNIFKALAAAMLMPAMLLTTACSNEDDLVNNTANTENTINKGYALPVTVNVTRQGDEGTTRATYTYDEGTKKGTLAFSDGDKLFVSGTADGYDYGFAGTLDYVSEGTFSGTIYIDKEWPGTSKELLATVKSYDILYATLLPAGYEEYGFLTIDNNGTEAKYDDYVDFNFTYTLASSKAAGVAQFSYEQATEYNNGFALEPQSTILNFTITGLAANTNVAVALTGNTSAYNITRTVTTDASGNATFAAGIYNGASLNLFSLTVGGNAITLPTKDAEVGKIYNITRSAAPAPAATDLSTITENYEAKNGETLTGTLGSNVKISIADGATVMLKDVTINGVNNYDYEWAGITCAGDATIILSGTNTVKGFYEEYPGIQAAAGKTLTIKGTGSLTASSYGWGAGIGGGSGVACGNIEIQGGTITATSGEYGAGIGGGNNASWGNITISGGTVSATGGERGAGIGGGRKGLSDVSCGNIYISGGTVNATGGEEAAGIGGGRGYNSGYLSSCGTITITTGVTKVTATKGSDAPNSIGAGNLGTCGTVTIGGNVGAITTSPYTYQP